ncbi:MAG: hypothetical protein WBF58_05580 [Xanthobacteraceae bacterium]
MSDTAALTGRRSFFFFFFFFFSFSRLSSPFAGDTDHALARMMMT